MLEKTSTLIDGIRSLLRQEMDRQGRSVRNLAASAEMSQSCLHRFLHGEHVSIHTTALFSVAFALGKNPAWMIREGTKLAREQ